jgi:hypothetical protein
LQIGQANWYGTASISGDGSGHLRPIQIGKLALI